MGKCRILAAICCLLASVVNVQAESFVLSPGTQVYACNSGSALTDLITAAGRTDYANAVLEVSILTATSCPYQGPFNEDHMHATVLHAESFDNGQVGYVVEWRFTTSDRLFYSALLRDPFGNHHDLVDSVLAARTAGGIIEWLLTPGQ